ncbi:hypothetical protein A6770_35610 [Nostoc minutum NIES-26]|uniref:Uncharacterized protein n=1 Tax=Nostoc minutum NIES-26 TaxID=1844469 RepID=A0A367S1V1_9NOSO|nr:hypothetical protein A6770_35610 [Nostoc minutum NIES-26]
MSGEEKGGGDEGNEGTRWMKGRQRRGDAVRQSQSWMPLATLREAAQSASTSRQSRPTQWLRFSSVALASPRLRGDAKSERASLPLA